MRHCLQYLVLCKTVISYQMNPGKHSVHNAISKEQFKRATIELFSKNTTGERIGTERKRDYAHIYGKNKTKRKFVVSLDFLALLDLCKMFIFVLFNNCKMKDLPNFLLTFPQKITTGQNKKYIHLCCDRKLSSTKYWILNSSEVKTWCWLTI